MFALMPQGGRVAALQHVSILAGYVAGAVPHPTVGGRHLATVHRRVSHSVVVEIGA